MRLSLFPFQGWEDMKLLAKSYQRQVPNILTKEYDPANFLVSQKKKK